MIWPILIIGGPVFWVLAVFWLLGLLWALDGTDRYDYDDCWGGTMAAVVTGLFMIVLGFTGMELNGWLAKLFEHWQLILEIYIPAGLFVAFVKWVLFCHDDTEELACLICAWKRKNNLADPDSPVIPSEQRQAFLKYLSERYNGSRWVTSEAKDGKRVYVPVRPTWHSNKVRISVWATWWWIVGPWTVIHDFVHRGLQRILAMFGGWFDALAKWIRKDIDVNFDVNELPPRKFVRLPAADKPTPEQGQAAHDDECDDLHTDQN